MDFSNVLESETCKTIAVCNNDFFQCLSCTFLIAHLLNAVLSEFFMACDFFFLIIIQDFITQVYTKIAVNE